MYLCTHASIVSDALKYVERNTERLKTLQKIDERVTVTEAKAEKQEEEEEEEETTNQIF